MTLAQAAVGTFLYRNSVKVAELFNVGDVVLDGKFIDVSSHDSLEEGFREYIADKLKDPSEVAIEGNWIITDVAQNGLKDDMDAGTISDYLITYPNGASWAFPGLVKQWKSSSPIEKQLIFGATLKMSGAPTLGITLSTGLTTPFLALSGDGTLLPAAGGSTYEYIYNVATGIASVSVTPTAAAGVIIVNGTVVASGEASGAIALGAAGSITNIIVVVTETNKTPKIYTIKVARAAAA